MAVRRVIAGTALVLPLLAGCGGGDEPPAALPTALTTAPAVQPTTVATAAVDVVDVFATAEATDTTAQLDRRTMISGGLVFVVVERRPDRLQVQLPSAPAGSTGWVRAQDVTLTADPYALEVSLSRHELVVRNGADVVLSTPAGTGTTDRLVAGTPYFVTELLKPPDPTGPYGPYAYGLSGAANTAAAFAAGTGVLALSGTNAPQGLGTDVPGSGVVIANDVVTRLAEEVGLPLGTPVTVLA